jgi:tyrosyl-tRNA synthetase
MTKSDGGKFGKTEKGNVWLDAEKTSPYQFYQFWLNATDADAEKWIKIFTFMEKDAIASITEKHRENPAARELQKMLAKTVTIFVHGEDGYTKAIETTQKLFDAQNASVDSLSADDLENMEGVIKFEFPAEKIQAGIDIVSFLAETGSFPSKGEARKMIQSGVV